jgi:hypothetical protein
MKRIYGRICLLAVLLGLGLTSSAADRRRLWGDDDSIYPRIVASVTAIDRRGLAKIQTRDGAIYEVVRGTGWRIGDTVECERGDRQRYPLWKAIDCHKVS